MLQDQMLRNAAPVFEPMEAENGQLMEGVFERIVDADGPGKWGGFPEPPEDLQGGGEIKFEFETPLSQAYRRADFDKAVQVTQYQESRIQVGDGGVSDLLNSDEMNRAAFGAIAPKKWLLAQEEVDAARQAKQQQAAVAAGVNAVGEAAGIKGPKNQGILPSSSVLPALQPGDAA